MINLLIYVILPVIILSLEFWGFKNYYCLNPDNTFRRIRMTRIVAFILIGLGFIPVANLAGFVAILAVWPCTEADKENKFSPFKDITGMTPKEVFGPEPTWGDKLMEYLAGNFFEKKKENRT